MWRDEGLHEIEERECENFGKNSIIKLLIRLAYYWNFFCFSFKANLFVETSSWLLILFAAWI